MIIEIELKDASLCNGNNVKWIEIIMKSNLKLNSVVVFLSLVIFTSVLLNNNYLNNNENVSQKQNNQNSFQFLHLHNPLKQNYVTNNVNNFDINNNQNQIQLNELKLNDPFPSKTNHNPIQISSNNGFVGFPGSGTINDPYLIENFIISNYTTTDLIHIENTTTYFVIRNNNLLNGSSGIYFNNVTNGIIFNNYIANNSNNGIYLDSSNINVITSNIVSNNSQYGINLYNSRNNKISYNTLSNNNINGIYLSNSFYNEILSNKISFYTQQGIFLIGSNSNTISSNTISNITNYGIYLSTSQSTTITWNTIKDSSSGIFLSYSIDSIISLNEIFNNTNYGIYMIYASYNRISYNTIKNNFSAISLYTSSDNNSFLSNIIENNQYYGIVGYGQNNIIEFNSIRRNREGIYLNHANSTKVTHNLFANNTNSGIYFYYSNFTSVLFNSFTKNLVNALYFELNSHNNSILSNTIANSSSFGIDLSSCYNNSIKYNNFLYNNVGSIQANDNAFVNNTFAYNYWNDWVGPDINLDGFVDSAYSISGTANNFDKFPKTTKYNLTSPIIDNPSDLTYVEKSTGNSIIWNVGSQNPSTYNVTIDNSLYVSNTFWVNGTIPISVDGLSLGTHVLTIYLFDIYGNSISDTVLIKVIENLIPEISNPKDIVYKEGSIGNFASWKIGDQHPFVYDIKLDGGTLVPTSYWINETLTINIDNLSLGTHNLIINVYDIYNNIASDPITITVIDTVKPIIDNPSDISYQQGSTRNSITWNVGDRHPYFYNATLDGSIFISNTIWINGTITIKTDGLKLGSFFLTINLYDTSLNKISDTVKITIFDFIKPQINHPQDVIYDNGTSGNVIIWNVADQNPDTYNVTMNNTLFMPNTLWKNGSISVNIDGLMPGVYIFMIQIRDISGNYNSDTVKVTVKPNHQISSNDSNISNTNETSSAFLPSYIFSDIILTSLVLIIINKIKYTKKRNGKRL